MKFKYYGRYISKIWIFVYFDLDGSFYKSWYKKIFSTCATRGSFLVLFGFKQHQKYRINPLLNCNAFLFIVRINLLYVDLLWIFFLINVSILTKNLNSKITGYFNYTLEIFLWKSLVIFNQSKLLFKSGVSKTTQSEIRRSINPFIFRIPNAKFGSIGLLLGKIWVIWIIIVHNPSLFLVY